MEEKIFTLPEAKALLPWLLEATREAEQQARRVQTEHPDPNEAQAHMRAIIQHWAETAIKLGALPKQPFTIDFNSGKDYFCWEYPETEIKFRHGYNAGYAGRKPIEDEL